MPKLIMRGNRHHCASIINKAFDHIAFFKGDVVECDCRRLYVPTFDDFTRGTKHSGWEHAPVQEYLAAQRRRDLCEEGKFDE